MDVIIVRLQLCWGSASLCLILSSLINSNDFICIVKQIIYHYARNTLSYKTQFKMTVMPQSFQNIIVPVQQQTKQFWTKECTDMHFNALKCSLICNKLTTCTQDKNKQETHLKDDHWDRRPTRNIKVLRCGKKKRVWFSFILKSRGYTYLFRFLTHTHTLIHSQDCMPINTDNLKTGSNSLIPVLWFALTFMVLNML